jgi:hypothetical protein
MNGKGELTYNNDVIYSGNWLDGKPKGIDSVISKIPFNRYTKYKNYQQVQKRIREGEQKDKYDSMQGRPNTYGTGMTYGTTTNDDDNYVNYNDNNNDDDNNDDDVTVK